MAEKDMVEKTLESYEDVFADIINVLIFNGKQIVKPESLHEIGIKSQYKADGKIHEMERDTAKLWESGNVKFALVGLENQTKSEKDMPLRVIGYDGNAYRSQLLNDSKDRYPVVTLVLYFGKGHWNQPKNLNKVVSIPKELENYVNDYKINVFEISWLTDEQVDMFRSDFKIVADYFTQVRKNNCYIPMRDDLKHPDEVLKLLGVFGEDRRFSDYVDDENRKEVRNMCEWLDVVEEKNQKIGLEQGLEQGRIEAIQRMLRKGCDKDFIFGLDYTEEEYAKAENELMALA